MTSQTGIRIPQFLVRAFALCAAVFSLLIVLALWSFFVNSQQGQLIDETAFQGSLGLKTQLWWLAGPILDVVSVLFIGGAVIVVAGIALVRKQWWLAVQAVTLIAGANITTQVLKKVILDRPDHGVVWVPGNSFPSGHTTAAASIALALVIVVPRQWRIWTAGIGAIYTVATGVSTLVGQWHRPSDVLGAIFVASAWCLAVCAVAKTSGEEHPEGAMSKITIVGILVMVIGALLSGIIGWNLLQDVFTQWETTAMTDSGIQKNAFLGSCFAIVCATLLVFGISLITRQAAARMR